MLGVTQLAETPPLTVSLSPCFAFCCVSTNIHIFIVFFRFIGWAAMIWRTRFFTTVLLPSGPDLCRTQRSGWGFLQLVDGTDDATTQDPALLSAIGSCGLTLSSWSSAAPAQRAPRATTPERGLLAETEGRPALTDASGKKHRKLKQSLCFPHTKRHSIFAFGAA